MYQKTNWQSGDTITAAKLNNIENGIAGGGVLVVHEDMDGMLDKTWQQIYDAPLAIIELLTDEPDHQERTLVVLTRAGYNDNSHYCNFLDLNALSDRYIYSCASATDYPVVEE